ncbi:MlaD family protein [Henriciella aquimarina]|uniref:MlaD family protein n=1 Tax=Henriciella aquimarina TaxID=545261 RepID=UPI000A00AF27|nr:MlaD family protein [Henriciella aquimarina]
METRANYAMIGAFVILAILSGLGFVLWLGQSQFNQDFDVYDIVFDGPVNLEDGASVRYIGIKVGEVESIGIDRNDASKVRARIRVDSETPVKTDSTASIEFAGITGVTFVQINAGSPDAERLQRASNQEVPEIKSISSPVAELFSSGNEVMGRANLALENIGKLLSDENVESVSNTIANIEAISSSLSGEGNLSADLSEVLASVNQAAESIDRASRSFDSLGTNAEKEVTRIGTQISDLLTELEGMSDSARRSIESSEQAITAATGVIEGPATDAVTDFRLIAQDLRVLIRRLDRLTRELEQNPQGLLRSDPVPYEGDRK